MEIFLIAVLEIAVFAIWRSGQDAADRMRSQVEALEQEIGFIRGQVATLRRNAASTASAAAMAKRTPPPEKQPEAAPLPTPRPDPVQQPSALHSSPPAITRFRPPAEVPSTPLPPVPQAPPVPPPVYQPKPLPPSPVMPKVVAEEVRPVTTDELAANWLNNLGIAILVIRLAFFLAYRLQTWGPAGKVLCGDAVTFALLAGGVWHGPSAGADGHVDAATHIMQPLPRSGQNGESNEPPRRFKVRNIAPAVARRECIR